MSLKNNLTAMLALHMVILGGSGLLPASAAKKTVKGVAPKKTSPPPFPFHKPDWEKETIPLTGDALEAWNNGEKAFRALDYRGAAEQFRKVVDLNPDYSRGHERLGSALAAAEDYDNADLEMNKAIKLNPKDYLPHLVLGRIILVKQGEAAGTAEAQKAFDINPWACAAFLDFANQDRFDEHKWFVLANYWKEMQADMAKVKAAQPKVVKKGEDNSDEPCCDACAAKGIKMTKEECAKAAMGKTTSTSSK